MYKRQTPAGADDFDTEFLDYILAVKVVDSVEEAVEHISKHSTGHSEAIITESKEAADYFTMRVDSAAVYAVSYTHLTRHTRSASRLRGTLVRFSGHIWCAIMSFSLSVKEKRVLALRRAVCA